MNHADYDLLRWVNSGKSKRSSATLGQLILLLEMVGSDSVAAISGGNASHAVNYRQKLARLERTLGVGALTATIGKSTRVTEIGRRIAGEVRMLLAEMQHAADAASLAPTWIIGAGESWLQSVIVPALGEIVRTHPEWKWEVRNLRSRDICEGVREGEIHFGFVRRGDIHATDAIEENRPYDYPGYAVIAGGVSIAHRSAKELIAWLIDRKRPFIQQGSSWKPIRGTIGRVLRAEALLAELEPVVSCETHPQAAAAAERGQSWCIVPASVAWKSRTSGVVIAKVEVRETKEDMALISSSRRLSKLPGAEAVTASLKAALGKSLRYCL